MSDNPLSFHEWCESGSYQLLPEHYLEGSGRQNIYGYVYPGELCIECTYYWDQDNPNKMFKYYLMIGNEEYLSDSLNELEEKLYDYYKSQH